MGNPTAIRLFDRMFGFLLRPAVKRARRWSFVVTIPVGLLAAQWTGLRPSFEDGLLVAAVLVLLDIVVVAGVAVLATALLGQERRDALLDLVMHPVARRAIAGELRVLGVFLRALLRPTRRAGALRFSYHRGSSSLGVAIALLPGMAAEATVVHLLLPGDWLVVKVVVLALTIYGAVMLVGLALAERVYPHEFDGETLELRSGTLYRATIALASIMAVERRRERADRHSGLVLVDDAARLVARGRTDLMLTLSEPVWIERPLGNPVAVTRLAFAADDAAAVEAALASPPRTVTRARPRRGQQWLPALDAYELLGT